MTTNKQTDYFKQYGNVEFIRGSGILGYARVIGQLKNDKWAVWDVSMLWGGKTDKPKRLRDLSGNLVSFETKDAAALFAESLK